MKATRELIRELLKMCNRHEGQIPYDIQLLYEESRKEIELMEEQDENSK